MRTFSVKQVEITWIILTKAQKDVILFRQSFYPSKQSDYWTVKGTSSLGKTEYHMGEACHHM